MKLSRDLEAWRGALLHSRGHLGSCRGDTSISEHPFFPECRPMTVTSHSRENEQEPTAVDSASDLFIVSANTTALCSGPSHSSLHSGPVTGISGRTESVSTLQGNQDGPCKLPYGPNHISVGFASGHIRTSRVSKEIFFPELCTPPRDWPPQL